MKSDRVNISLPRRVRLLGASLAKRRFQTFSGYVAQLISKDGALMGPTIPASHVLNARRTKAK